MDGLMRHLDAVGRATPTGDFLPFRLAAAQIGWVTAGAARLLARRGCRLSADGVTLPDPAGLGRLTRDLADTGAFPWRGEAFDVRAVPDGPVLAVIDRGALPWFGVGAEGVHVNGLVECHDGPHLWVGRRAADRLMDPGKLDHLCAGGIPAGLTRGQTLVKEGAEEAGLPAGLVAGAVPAGEVAYVTLRPEGLRRDRLHCYDLLLPETFVPRPEDGEVAGFELWPIGRVIDTVRNTERFKFNVSLVLIDLFLRRGLLGGDEAAALDAALRQLRQRHADSFRPP